jgi:CBS domain-containing protein
MTRAHGLLTRRRDARGDKEWATGNEKLPTGPATKEVDMLVREAMTDHAEWITPDTTLIEAACKMRDKGIGCLPVGENDRLIGIITDRDLACRAVATGADPKKTEVRKAMTKGIVWCYEEESLDKAVQRMEEKQIHHMPVLSPAKRMVGMLSLSDIALKGPRTLSREVTKLASRDASRHTHH